MKGEKQEYRVFVGAFPGGELGQRLQALRGRYDPRTARITGPHVTLAGTYWRSGPATAQNESPLIARLLEISPKIRPFELELGGIQTFPPARQPVIYLAVALTPGLLAGRQALLAVAGNDRHDHYTPHLTLAMRLQGEGVERMLADLHSSAWDTQRFSARIGELCLMQRGPADPAWRTIARLVLGEKA